MGSRIVAAILFLLNKMSINDSKCIKYVPLTILQHILVEFWKEGVRYLKIQISVCSNSNPNWKHFILK